MIDANQRWDVGEAITWLTKLAEFRPMTSWGTQPSPSLTRPKRLAGGGELATAQVCAGLIAAPNKVEFNQALATLGIGVATGEQCHNRVMFKQLLQASALQFVQIDSCRLGSVNENLAVLLMACKFQGGVGLCELVQHLILFDYISVSASLHNRMREYVDHLHKHFKSPVVIQDARYMPPKVS
ncbi:hypothetical protein AAFF_G00027030 [Aldrovandia affinis]|uniref:Enolase C-terminal domain-containing protein n=1 Tax=Aldrovandia affinis TaxID=143900 RepID=A0AAD7R2E8_9TELE|nr:hypothetical protein AAFF_G00027030 [Aldrovandia affinis]